MKSTDVFQIILFIFAIITLAPVLGVFFAKVLKGEGTFLTPFFGRLERFIYKICGVNPNAEMNWKEYAKSLLVFNFLGADMAMF